MVRYLACLLAILMMGNTIIAETVEVIQDFSKDADLSAWTPVDRATISFDQDSLKLEKPKYTGGPEQWPRADRKVGDWDFTRFNGVEITIRNSGRQSQRMDLLLGDRLENTYYSTQIPAGETRTCRFRFDEGYNDVDWSDIQWLRVMRTTPDADYVWNIQRIALFTDDEATTPRGKIAALLAACDESLNQSAADIDSARADALRNDLAKWHTRLNEKDGLRGLYRNALVELAASQAAIARAKAEVQAQSQPDPALLAWVVVPGQTFRPTEAMLQFRQPAGQVSIRAAHGEYGEGILRLTNMSAKTQELRLRIKPPEGAALPGLTVRQNIPIMGRDKSLTGDALTPLDLAGLVTLPPEETVELWIRADVRHAEWPNGKHAFTLEVRDLRRPSAPVTTLPIEVEVLNVDLTKAAGMHVQLWPEISHPRSWIVHGREELARDNLFDYGADIISFLRSEAPQATFTADGEIESIDFGPHDKTVAFYRAGGKPLLLYWLQMDVGSDDIYWTLHKDFEPGSDVWKKALANWLGAWKQHMDEQGISPAEYAFYVTDEPDSAELQRTYLFAEVAKSVDPALRIYVNGSHALGDDLEWNERFLKLVDIWQPDENHITTELRNLLDSHPHIERWVYQCKMSRRSYDVNMHDYYRLMSWRMLREGGKGIGYWTYSATHPGEDPWDETLGEAAGGILVYPDTQHGLIMSARWELIRMSLDDARYADLLRKATPVNDAQRKTIDALLGDKLAGIVDNPDKPELVAEWRLEAGTLLDSLAK